MSAEIVLVERLDSHGRVQSHDRLWLSGDRRTFTIGRSVHADVTLDDPHAAGLHASIEIAGDGRILASDLGSVNGLIIGASRCNGATGLLLADNTLQIGRTRLRVRTAREQLEPEKPYHRSPLSLMDGSAWIAGISAVVVGLQVAYGSWLAAPRDLAATIVAALAVLAAAATVWVAFWGLLSRVIQGEWPWVRHAAISLGVAAIFTAVTHLLDLSDFLLSLPRWNTRYVWVAAVALGFALYLHLTNASNLAVRRAALVACLLPALSAIGSHWLLERYQLRDVNYIASHVRIYPPSLRLRASDTVESYFKRAAALRERANERLSDAVANDRDFDDR